MSSTDSFVTQITEKESMEFFMEGMKAAASAARQLAIAQEHPIWADISKLCDEIHNSGVHLATSKPLSRERTLQIIGRREKQLSQTVEIAREPNHKPKFIIN